jgi:hypothetical protein
MIVGLILFEVAEILIMDFSSNIMVMRSLPTSFMTDLFYNSSISYWLVPFLT